MDATVKWLGHASFEIKAGDKTIYIDPYEGEYEDKADLILMTHSHPDHCDAGKIGKILRKGTLVIAPVDCAEKAGVKVKSLKPGEAFRFEGIGIKAVEAYNNKRFRSPGIPFHPKGFGVGYLITIHGKTVTSAEGGTKDRRRQETPSDQRRLPITIYHAGDTDYIPEMKALGKVTFALLPCGGTYTMDVQEAKEAILAIKPGSVVPMHSRGQDVRGLREVEKSGIKVAILRPGEEFRI